MAQYTIEFTVADKEQAQSYAEKVAGMMLDRRNVGYQKQVRDVRIGTLGEITFYKCLEILNKIPLGAESMFSILEDEFAHNNYDFRTSQGETIDIKTASLSYHSRILVPQDQYHNLPKDYYVGVRISESEETGTVIGYARHNELRIFERANYHPAYAISLNNLHPIEELANLFPQI